MANRTEPVLADVALDPRDFLSCIVVLRMSTIRVFYTLCVDDQKLVEDLRPCFVRVTPTTFF
ncbi:hypothetical protein SAMN05421754_100933 [Nitrosomonas sp. Nm58]|nr:hypothetical protein SAMN05421754_100933 [Nitrosomonas sp. Nm58]